MSSSLCTFAATQPTVNQNTTTVNSGYEISPYKVDYSAQNVPVTGTTDYSNSIELTNEFKYGKAFYSNLSDSYVTMTVIGKGVNKSITIAPHDGKPLEFEKSGLFNQTYKISVHCSTENLNGIFSSGRSDNGIF